VILAVLLLGVIFFTSSHFFGFAWQGISSNEIGVKMVQGQFQEILGPGIYSDMTFFADLVPVSIEGFAFTASDPEVLTSDLQRIGVTVSGTVHNPGLGKMTADLWSTYRQLYTDPAVKQARMETIAQQAMKVCVGEKTFAQAAVGTARNDLTVCIDEQLSTLAGEFGLDVRNVTVPNVTIGADVQAQLDQITASRGATLFAEQEKLRLEAEAQRNLAEQQGQILVEQGRIQEEFTQRAITAKLEQDALLAERAVIDQHKSNDLASANGDLRIAEVNREISEQKALADTADERAQAAVLQANPLYAQYLQSQVLAQALSGAQTIIIPAGTNPLLMFGGDQLNGVTPTVDVTPQTDVPN
jgi:hypothetical protein